LTSSCIGSSLIIVNKLFVAFAYWFTSPKMAVVRVRAKK
jgi:hypothetical protein